MHISPIAPGPVAVRAAAAGLLIFSHVALVPSMAWTWRRRRRLWIEFAIHACIFTWSTAYHVCYQVGYCVFDAHTHRATDHYYAKLCAPLVIFYLACIDSVHVKGLFVVAIAQLNVLCSALFGVGAGGAHGADDEAAEEHKALVANALVFGTCLALSAAYWAVVCIRAPVCKARLLPWWHSVDWIDAAFGVALCSSAPIFFVVSDSVGDAEYYFAHSLWHALAFAGVYFVFETRNPERTLGVPTRTWKRLYARTFASTRSD